MTMKETIDRNHLEMRRKYNKQKEIARKQEKKEQILVAFIGIAIIIGVFMLMGTMNDNAKNICEKQNITSYAQCLRDVL